MGSYKLVVVFAVGASMWIGLGAWTMSTVFTTRPVLDAVARQQKAKNNPVYLVPVAQADTSASARQPRADH